MGPDRLRCRRAGFRSEWLEESQKGQKASLEGLDSAFSVTDVLRTKLWLKTSFTKLKLVLRLLCSRTARGHNHGGSPSASSARENFCLCKDKQKAFARGALFSIIVQHE